jgi:hypothetical protein
MDCLIMGWRTGHVGAIVVRHTKCFTTPPLSRGWPTCCLEGSVLCNFTEYYTDSDIISDRRAIYCTWCKKNRKLISCYRIYWKNYTVLSRNKFLDHSSVFQYNIPFELCSKNKYGWTFPRVFYMTSPQSRREFGEPGSRHLQNYPLLSP